MAPARWLPPSNDTDLGLGFYATASDPVRGRIKADASDFQVQEISAYPYPSPAGEFTVVRVRSRDWEQHELAQRLAGRLGLAPHALSWAGTKDRRAVSERLFSYRGRPPAGPIELPGVEVLEAYRARDGLVLGHHYGNSFALRISELEEPAPRVIERFRGTIEELRTGGGLPNLFGPQRFGEVRPVTHRVGRELVHGDPAAAVETYLSYLPGSGDSLGELARRAYAADHDPVRALREFPPSFRFERRLLDHLARGHTPERALGALSRELRRLFVHAYQSLLFNRWLTARWTEGLRFDEPAPGDRLLRMGPDGTARAIDPIPVDPDNLPECRELVQRGRAVIGGPLVGFETPWDPEGVGHLLVRILESESVRPQDFALPKTPELASAGSWRPATVPMPPVALRPEPADPATARPNEAVTAGFSLPKGSYATILVRELLKPGATLTDHPSNQPF